jgi:polar amino acid transport system substrate-binding protein
MGPSLSAATAGAPRKRLPWACIIPAAAEALAACSTNPMTTQPSSDAVRELAPTGTLRAVINVGNPVLAGTDPSSGEPRGVSVDLARELARRLGTPLSTKVVTTAAMSVDTVKSGDVDIAFIAIDPKRAEDMDFTAAYVLIEGAYMVPARSPIMSNGEVDRAGVRVGVGGGSAYDLFLTRELKRAQIVRTPTSQGVVDNLVAGHVDVAAGVKQQLESDRQRVAGLRLLDGRFMVIQQAMATPKGRPDGARYLAAFVEEMKASGFVASALQRHGIDGATVAPPSGH